MQILNLQPPTMEWRLYRNDTSVMTLILVDSNDAPIDLDSWDFIGYVREFPTNETAIAELFIEKNENVLTVDVSNANLPLMSYFDIQGTNSVTGQVNTIISGQIIMQEDVSRWVWEKYTYLTMILFLKEQ